MERPLERFTQADPVMRDVLTIFKIRGLISNKHPLKIEAGIGSDIHVVEFIVIITLKNVIISD